MMNNIKYYFNKRYFFLVIFIFMFSSLAFSFGSKEKNKETLPVVQITGIVRLVGTSTFPELIISDSQTDWHVIKEERSKLNDFQHHTVIVEGEETVIELQFANGLPAGTRRELRNIRIIAVHEWAD